MAWLYEQSSGKLLHDGEFVAQGYSGTGIGKNNPDMQDHIGLGPLPRGRYSIHVICDGNGNWIDYEGKKSPVMRLVPAPGNQMFGRDGFLIHGDSVHAPGTASHGCIIEAHDIRVRIAQSGDPDLEVV